ncbi:hypothetical protein AZE42_10557, partial [Rhizopogon vesiculosus]
MQMPATRTPMLTTQMPATRRLIPAAQMPATQMTIPATQMLATQMLVTPHPAVTYNAISRRLKTLQLQVHLNASPVGSY